MKILLRSGALKMIAEMHDTPTAKAIFAVLPLSARANTWGDEIYFEIPVSQELEPSAAEVVEAGDLGYWPTGKAFCVFFGPTPVSRGNEIRPASAVNVFGKVIGDAGAFNAVRNGDLIHLDVAP